MNECNCIQCVTRRQYAEGSWLSNDSKVWPSDIDWIKNMKTTMTRRFYVGSTDMSRTFLENGEPPKNMMILSEAIEKGKRLVESENHELVFIVEVVKVIKRARQPIVVEDVT